MEMIKRKEFDDLFLPYNQTGTQIWVINKIKELPIEIIQFVLNLAKLDFINYVRIDGETLAASSENHPNRPKEPFVQMYHPTATCIEVLYSHEYKIVDFYDINSTTQGNGRIMADSILKDFPEGWSPVVFRDWSNGFWDHIKKKYNHLDWLKDPF
jgi:hypothetical protein